MGDINRALDKLEQLREVWEQNQSDVWGVPTGFKALDHITGGLHRGEVFVVGARTSHGKTALANQIAFNVVKNIAVESAREGIKTGQVMLFSPEMSAHMLMMRQASILSQVPINSIRRGNATEEEKEAWQKAIRLLRLYDPYVHIKAQGDMSVQDIVTYVETQHQGSGTETKLVVIDYVQYLTSASGKDNSYEQVSGVTKEIKDMANRLEIPVLLLSQMNRKAAQNHDDEGEDVPELHELEGSGKIEARADVVGLLWRPNKVTDAADTDPQKALIRIGKNRNGPVGIATLFYYPALTMFVDGPEYAT